MDGSLAIEANRIALKRIVAMLVEMAGLGEEGAPGADKFVDAPDSPHSGLLRKPPLPLKGGEEERPAPPPPLPCTFEEAVEESAASRPALPLPRRSGERWHAKRDGVGVEFPCDAPHPDARAQGTPRRTLPRVLWRAILKILRPAESAARRLIIAASRGIALPHPHPRKSEPKPQPIEPLLRRLGIAVMMAPANATRDGISSPAKRIPTFPLFDPPRRLALHGRRRPTVPPHAAPRIFVPGLTELHRLPPPPSSDDLVNSARLTQRLAALAAALDDLPGQARRFARWQARRQTARLPIRRVPPGGRLFRYDPSAAHPPNVREIDEILAHAHSLALHALEGPDTS